MLKGLQGIRRSGASCLLLSDDQIEIIRRRYPRLGPRRRAYPPEDFESLSPICFYNEAELSAKLGTLTTKFKKGVGYPDTDNSSANKKYYLNDTKSGLARGMFEHSRYI